MNQLVKISLIALCLLQSPILNASPRVSISIAPIHSLASGLMEGIGEPILILDQAVSPHLYSLTPKQRLELENSDLIIWVGPELESFLAKPIETLTNNAVLLTLLNETSLSPLASRAPNQHSHGSRSDPHLWLDPNRAILIANKIAEALIKLDPKLKKQYENNLIKLTQKLNELDTKLESILSEYRNHSFWVYHDAYQYFEKNYELSFAGALTQEPEQGFLPLSVLKLKKIALENQKNDKTLCLFLEPQFSKGPLRKLFAKDNIQIKTLDPMGIDLPPGKALYFYLMTKLTKDFVSCFYHTPYD